MHSLESADFVEKDAVAACGFGEAAAEAGLVRIIYLGGLGRDNQQLSDPHRRRATLSRSSPPRCWGRWWPSSAARGGALAPILTHVTWSLSMLFALPPIFGDAS